MRVAPQSPHSHHRLNDNCARTGTIVSVSLLSRITSRKSLISSISSVGAPFDYCPLELHVADLTVRSKLAQLNEQLTTLERRVEFLEARITRGETLN